MWSQLVYLRLHCSLESPRDLVKKCRIERSSPGPGLGCLPKQLLGNALGLVTGLHLE